MDCAFTNPYIDNNIIMLYKFWWYTTDTTIMACIYIKRLILATKNGHIISLIIQGAFKYTKINKIYTNQPHKRNNKKDRYFDTLI